MSGVLYYGDNLPVLRKWVDDESVDLVYLDPPFNSKRMFNQLHRGSEAQDRIFKDYWEWDDAAEAAYREIIAVSSPAPRPLVALMESLLRVLERDKDLLAYLSMMTLRLMELRRVLKPTGSLYLHCDPTASHYLKLVLDVLFGPQNFRNEIVWKRSSAHSDGKQGAKHFGRVSDTILFYSKTDGCTFNQLYTPYDEGYVERDYRRTDPDGRRYRIDNIQGPGGAAKGNPFYEFLGVKRYWRYSRERMQKLYDEGRIVQTKPGAVPQYKRYLDEMPGMPLQNVWTDVPVINNRSKEHLPYPTQKPLALLERIVSASSKPGDVVLDPFCGCGTTIEACKNLDREWIGVDVAPQAVDVIRERMAKVGVTDLKVIGWPMDLQGAKRLAKDDKIGFQRWAVFMAGGRLPDGRQYSGGADGGVDGEIIFDDGGRKLRAIVSVKAGGVGANDIRVLRNVVDDTHSQMGIFLSMTDATPAMRNIARDGGFFTDSHGVEHRKIQLYTAEQLLKREKLDIPGQNVTPESTRPGALRKGQTLALPFGADKKKRARGR